MKPYMFAWAALFQPSASAAARAETTQDLRIATYNVRYDKIPDRITVQETIDSLPSDISESPSAYYQNLTEQPWSTRRIHIANDVLSSGAQIYGGQELHLRQVNDMQELLGSKWSWVGVGRDPDHPRSNEYNPIFYRNDILTLETWDTFWLSLTPFEVSKFEGAGSYRLCTTAHFTGSSGAFTVMNTHLDDRSADQRALGVSLILHRAKYEAIKTRRPVFLTGDFNSPQHDEAYQIMTGSAPVKPISSAFRDKFSWKYGEGSGFEDFNMKDLLAETPPQYRSGNYATFTSWSALDNTAKLKRIDYIFAGATSGWSAEAYRVGQSLYDDGVYASDHRPVFADIELEPSPYVFQPKSIIAPIILFIFHYLG